MVETQLLASGVTATDRWLNLADAYGTLDWKHLRIFKIITWVVEIYKDVLFALHVSQTSFWVVLSQ